MQLREMGSFYVGGREISVHSQSIRSLPVTASGIPSTVDPNGTYQAEHMYVQYFIPEEALGKMPLLLWHGAGLTGVTYETTPDGREGWLNYFIKRGWPVYNTDSVERGRSGWTPMHGIFQEAPMMRTKRDIFERYHIGDGAGSYSEDPQQMKVLPGNQFPIESYHNFSKQIVPRWSSTADATIAAYTQLVEQVGPCIILAHSQGGQFAFQVAQRCPEKVKCIVAIEPAIRFDKQIAESIQSTEVLFVFGDYMERDERWSIIRGNAQKYCNELNQSGGFAELINLPEIGIEGNSHMMMMDRNNLQVADVIQSWLSKREFCSDRIR